MSTSGPTGPESDVSTTSDDGPPVAAKQSILASSAVMAAGTMFSRFSGLIRSVLLAAALGSAGIAADSFTVANTIPNMIYILLAGGVFNAVLVPQLVRALKDDPDGGEAYTNRIMTLGMLFLGVVTFLLVVFAPALMRIFLDPDWFEPEMATALDSVITLARWCLPQVFFYGMFTLVGQVLNSRGSFGPMMWAPIANNVIAVGVLVTYLVVFGPVSGLVKDGHFSDSQMALLGLGSTAGIVVQLLVLLPFMRKAGFRYRPRFDFRGTGLGHTLRLAVWTVLFIVVNQISYTIVVRLLSGGTAAEQAGQFVYANSFMITMLPHGVITVSLVTALLPRLSRQAAAGELRVLGATLTSTLRTALVVVFPFAVLLALLGGDLANVLYGYGASAGSSENYIGTLAFFAVALIFFTVHYFMLRGFYALEQTRTVFFVQCALGATNIATAFWFTSMVSLEHRAAALAASYAVAYAVGSAVSWFVLRRQLGHLDGHRTLRFLVREALAVVVAGAVAHAAWWACAGWIDDPLPALSFVRGGVVGVVMAVAYFVMTRLLRIEEVAEVVDPIKRTVSRRLGRGSRA